MFCGIWNANCKLSPVLIKRWLTDHEDYLCSIKPIIIQWSVCSFKQRSSARCETQIANQIKPRFDVKRKMQIKTQIQSSAALQTMGLYLLNQDYYSSVYNLQVCAKKFNRVWNAKEIKLSPVPRSHLSASLWVSNSNVTVRQSLIIGFKLYGSDVDKV